MLGMRWMTAGAIGLAAMGATWAQDAHPSDKDTSLGAPVAGKPAYLNPNLPAEQRAADLVHRMTLEEKASQLVNQARAIPRLSVPAYDWWSEALHGVGRHRGRRSFRSRSDWRRRSTRHAIHEMAVAISIEARIKHAQYAAAHGGTAPSLTGWISGRRTSISFAIRDGGAGRRRTAKILF